LRLPGILDNLDMRIKEANEQNLGYMEFLSLLIQDERSQRSNNQFQKLLKEAGFGSQKTFEAFDFKFNGLALPEKTIRDLASCSFLEMGTNIVIAGPPGIGKTHIAKAIGHEACRRKRRVIYKNIYDIFSMLSSARTNSYYERIFKKIIRADLLILDDFALRKFDAKEVEILYAIVDSREETKSTILTSNRPAEDWINVFPDPVIAGAILDRLISGAFKLIAIKAKSYRKEGKAVDKKNG
jgi:DNA replication protein DnaC